MFAAFSHTLQTCSHLDALRNAVAWPPRWLTHIVPVVESDGSAVPVAASANRLGCYVARDGAI
jgi:hypothetical protein